MEANETIAPNICPAVKTCEDYLKPKSEDTKYFDAPAMKIRLNAIDNIITHLNDRRIFSRYLPPCRFQRFLNCISYPQLKDCYKFIRQYQHALRFQTPAHSPPLRSPQYIVIASNGSIYD